MAMGRSRLCRSQTKETAVLASTERSSAGGAEPHGPHDAGVADQDTPSEPRPSAFHSRMVLSSLEVASEPVVDWPALDPKVGNTIRVAGFVGDISERPTKAHRILQHQLRDTSVRSVNSTS